MNAFLNYWVPQVMLWSIPVLAGGLCAKLVVEIIWLRRLYRMLYAIQYLAERSLIASHIPLWTAWGRSLGAFNITIEAQGYRFDYDPNKQRESTDEQ